MRLHATDLCQALQISNQNLRDYLEENEDDTFEELTNENILMMVNDSKCASEGMSEASVSDEEPDKPATAKESLAALEGIEVLLQQLGKWRRFSNM